MLVGIDLVCLLQDLPLHVLLSLDGLCLLPEHIQRVLVGLTILCHIQEQPLHMQLDLAGLCLLE